MAYNIYTAPLASIIEKYGFAYHKYADDLQVYADCVVSDIVTVKANLERCLAEVRQWMLRWQLRINDEKSEFIMFTNSRVSVPDNVSLQLGGAVLTPSTSVKNLGVIFDKFLRRDQHVAHVLKCCNFALSKIGRIRKFVDQATCKRAMHALVLSRVDYCNSLLAGCPTTVLAKLQRLQNRAARLVICPGYRRRGVVIHSTPLLHELHWLPIHLRIQFKVSCLVYKCIHGLAPDYLGCLIQPATRLSRLRQPADGTLTVRRNRRKIGESSFSYMAPHIWNSLPQSLRQCDTLMSFRRQLKTYLWLNYAQ